jgi:arylsulfatase
LKGRRLKTAILEPQQPGPRGSVHAPGDGALLCWDGLHSLDKDWALSGALQMLTNMAVGSPTPAADRATLLAEAGRLFGAPDFRRRTFFRAVVDGRYKLVRWFSPEEYGNPLTLEDLYAHADVTLHDLALDPGEMENLGNPDHPAHDPAVVERMLAKLHALVRGEIGDDRAPFDLDLFGTRTVTDPAERRVHKRRQQFVERRVRQRRQQLQET